MGMACPHGIRCTFAHGPTELATFTSMHKTEQAEQLEPQQGGEGEVPETVALGALADAAPAVQVYHKAESMFGPPAAGFSHESHQSHAVHTTAASARMQAQANVSGSSGFADGMHT